MSWESFIQQISIEYELTASAKEVLFCLRENEFQTKVDLLNTFRKHYFEIEYYTFTKRLTNIYKKFQITGNGRKLEKLYRIICNNYENYQSRSSSVSRRGLTYVYPKFPTEVFSEKIDNVINSDDRDKKKVDIFQTFAPNLDGYSKHLSSCLQNNVQVRILLAWPPSRAAEVRQEALRRSSNANVDNGINISDCVIANLETLAKIISESNDPELLKIKLYDTSPSVAMYRAGDCMFVSNFFHGRLAIDAPQIELNLHASDRVLVSSYLQEFERVWQEMARDFRPSPNENWISDLKVLFLKN